MFSSALKVRVLCIKFNCQLYLPQDITAVRSTAHLALAEEERSKYCRIKVYKSQIKDQHENINSDQHFLQCVLNFT